MVLAAQPTAMGGFIIPLALDGRLLDRVLAALPAKALRAELRRRPTDGDLSGFRSVDILDELDRRGYASYRRSKDIHLGSVSLNRERRTVVWQGRTTGLSGREYDVVACLASQYPKRLTTPQIAEAVWGDAAQVQSARVYLSYLRRKIPGLLAAEKQHDVTSIKLFGLNVDDAPPTRTDWRGELYPVASGQA